MDNTLRQLLTLMEKGTVEQRCAALLVAGALKLDGAGLIKTVEALLQQSNPILKDYALRYCEEVKPKEAIPLWAQLLEDNDKDAQERAVRLLIAAGSSAVPPLLQRAAEASRPWQVNAARVLCAVHSKAALKGLLQLLRLGSDEFNKTICDLMTPAMRELAPAEQEALYAEVEDFAGSLDAKQQRPALISALRLVGQLGRPQSRRWLFKLVGMEHPAAVRSHALVALLQCLKRQELRKDEHAKLFALLEEQEFSEVPRLALELLDAHELPDDSRALLSRLMQSPHGEVQKFALRKMGDFGTPATVRTLVDQLGDSDYRRREVAARSLRKIPEARTALIKELLACADASKAWSLVELLASLEGKWRQDTLDSLWKRFYDAVEKEDRIQAAFLHLLKQANSEFAYGQLAAQGARLVKAKKYKEAVAFLLPLKEFSNIKPEQQFSLAVAQLKLHGRTVATHRQHPGLVLLTELLRNSAYPLFEALKKEKSLTPDELFALGFALAERSGDERSLGRDLLQHVASRFPRNKVGRNAKNKLKLIPS